MKKKADNYVNNLVNKILNETLEERADSLVARIKTNVNELDGMSDENIDDDVRPKFKDKNSSKMSDDEIEDLINNYFEKNSHDLSEWEDVDDLEEGFDSGEMKSFRRGKDFSKKEFTQIPDDASIDLSDLDDDSNSIQRFKNRRRKPQKDDDEFDMEVSEGFDSDDVKSIRHGKDYSKREFVKPLKRGNVNVDKNDDDSISINKFMSKKRRPQKDDDEFDMELTENETCECGGALYEGECNECGKSYTMTEEVETSNDEVNVEGCKTVKDVISKQGGKMTDLDKDLVKRYNCDSLKESLKGGQKQLDKNKNNKIDSEDFKFLRKGKKTETKESSKPDFLELNKDGDKKVPMRRANKDNKTKGKETIKLTESELIKLIENIVKENELKMKSTTHRGLSKHNDIHKKDGKINDDNIKSVATKMKDYLKDGSKGKYEENPKHFPKGNGELAKMDKKAFSITDDLEDFNYEIAGLNLPTPDAVEFNEDLMDDLYTGSHKTGNGPGGNAVETDVNKRFNKLRKKNTLKKIKDQSYNRVSQPVYNEKSGDAKGKGLSIKLESTEKETKVLNEEFVKIQHLMGYNRKTQ